MTILYLESTSTTSRIPTKATEDSACNDVYADLIGKQIVAYSSINTKKTSINRGDDENNYNIYPGDRVAIPTGWKMTTEQGYKITIAPRSGMSFKQGVTLINCIAQIDIDYRNEVFILLFNTSSKTVKIKHGDRIAQLMLEKVVPVKIIVTPTLPESNSNRIGGLGSTGK